MTAALETRANAVPFPVPASEQKAAFEQPEGLPPGFEARKSGIFRESPGKEDGPAKWCFVCSPLRVLALPRDGSGENWGRLVSFHDPDGRPHQWAIPASLLAGDGLELRARLMDMGLHVGSGRFARTALTDLLLHWRPRRRFLAVNRLGWTDDACTAFVLGDGRVIGSEQVVFQHEGGPGMAAEMRPAGTLDDWRETVAALCPGNPLLVACVSLAFAGPLLKPLGLDGGGMHLRGASSCGKSTAQRVAVSVWGTPQFLGTWRATANGLEGVAAACNGTLLALDEMGEVTGRDAGAAAYMLANGTGKQRAGKTGAARPSVRWTLPVLSSGEITLADKVAEDGRKLKAGQDVRLLDIAADSFAHGTFAALHGADSGAVLADRLKQATVAAHGTAGPAFVAGFLADRDGALKALRDGIAGFPALVAERSGFIPDGQTARAVQRLGLLAAAGEMAGKYGLTGWPEGTARDAALTVLGLWLEGRGGTGPAEARAAIEAVRAFLSAHGASRFERLCDHEPAFGAPIRDRAGWRVDDVFYIAQDAWKDIHRGADPKRSAIHLHDAGYLQTDEPSRMTKKTPERGGKRIRCFAVSADIIGAGHD